MVSRVSFYLHFFFTFKKPAKMKKQTDYTLLALSIPLALAVLFNLPGCYNTPKISNLHDCEMGIDCYYVGVEMTPGSARKAVVKMGLPAGSTGFTFDSLHIMRPDFTEEQLDSAVYGRPAVRPAKESSLLFTSHSCRWVNCPYKGVNAENAMEAIIEETGGDGTDSYMIDSMHIAHPYLDYDQLENLKVN